MQNVNKLFRFAEFLSLPAQQADHISMPKIGR